jgi:hypothetical protein
MAAIVLVVALSSCVTSTSATLTIPDSDSPHLVVTTSQTHDPYWITVKYRSGPVDVADPRFVFLSGGSSSVVDAAFYDPTNEYMIISLNGTAYHYCGTPSGVWSDFTAASSLGTFYNTGIKGNFDCRNGTVPQY